MSQFVSEVLSFSSEYSSTNGSARNLVGAPRCLNRYGDNSLAWCPGSYGRHECVEVSFDRPLYVQTVHIYENLNAGCVVHIEAHDGEKYTTVWRRDQPDHKRSYQVFEPTFEKIKFRSDRFKVHLDCTRLNYYAQVDAIEIVGTQTNFTYPESNLQQHLASLLAQPVFADIEAKLYHHPGQLKSIKLHKSILYARCPRLLDYLDKNDQLIDYLTYGEFKLLTTFIYTGEFQHYEFENLIESSKMRRESDDWMLVPNRFIRFATRYGIDDLDASLLDYIKDKLISFETVIPVLIDANRIELGVTLDQVDKICLFFVKENLNRIVLCPDFRLLPKEILLKIAQQCMK